MTPNVWFKVMFCGLALLIAAICGWYPEHLALVAYKTQVAAEGKVQEQHNKDLLVQQQLITKQVQNDYENKLARIKSYYGGLHYSSCGQLSCSKPSTQGTLGTPTDPQFVEKCAATTQQLESLIEFLNQQSTLK
jgi:hypothetical protein